MIAVRSYRRIVDTSNLVLDGPQPTESVCIDIKIASVLECPLTDRISPVILMAFAGMIHPIILAGLVQFPATHKGAGQIFIAELGESSYQV